jgi:RNA polymerase sigma-70 factor, ECF subfamily
VDIAPFNELVRRHQASIYRYLRFMGADAASADDLAQDTFTEAFRIVDRAPKPGDFNGESAWLRAIARNMFMRHWRRRKNTPEVLDGEILEKAEAAWKQEFLRDSEDGFDYVEALRECLRKVPPAQRAALDMRYDARKSRREMAASLSMTEDGVKSLLQRVRAALAECIQKRLAQEGGRK